LGTSFKPRRSLPPRECANDPPNLDNIPYPRQALAVRLSGGLLVREFWIINPRWWVEVASARRLHFSSGFIPLPIKSKTSFIDRLRLNPWCSHLSTDIYRWSRSRSSRVGLRPTDPQFPPLRASGTRHPAFGWWFRTWVRPIKRSAGPRRPRCTMPGIPRLSSSLPLSASQNTGPYLPPHDTSFRPGCTYSIHQLPRRRGPRTSSISPTRSCAIREGE
jgi:hypothetical protein